MNAYIHDIFWTYHVHSIYGLYPGGNGEFHKFLTWKPHAYKLSDAISIITSIVVPSKDLLHYLARYFHYVTKYKLRSDQLNKDLIR